MSEQEIEKHGYPGLPSSSAGAWLLLGVLFAVVGGAVASGGDDGEVFGLLIAAIGGLLLTIGAIAKGVEVGIRNARD